MATTTAKAKPNEKCPCGSGKKYKKCCSAKVRASQIKASREVESNDMEVSRSGYQKVGGAESLCTTALSAISMSNNNGAPWVAGLHDKYLQLTKPDEINLLSKGVHKIILENKKQAKKDKKNLKNKKKQAPIVSRNIFLSDQAPRAMDLTPMVHGLQVSGQDCITGAMRPFVTTLPKTHNAFPADENPMFCIEVGGEKLLGPPIDLLVYGNHQGGDMLSFVVPEGTIPSLSPGGGDDHHPQQRPENFLNVSSLDTLLLKKNQTEGEEEEEKGDSGSSGSSGSSGGSGGRYAALDAAEAAMARGSEGSGGGSGGGSGCSGGGSGVSGGSGGGLLGKGLTWNGGSTVHRCEIFCAKDQPVIYLNGDGACYTHATNKLKTKYCNVDDDKNKKDDPELHHGTKNQHECIYFQRPTTFVLHGDGGNETDFVGSCGGAWFDQFVRMQKKGVPEKEIRQKMMAHGVDPEAMFGVDNCELVTRMGGSGSGGSGSGGSSSGGGSGSSGGGGGAAKGSKGNIHTVSWGRDNVGVVVRSYSDDLSLSSTTTSSSTSISTTTTTTSTSEHDPRPFSTTTTSTATSEHDPTIIMRAFLTAADCNDTGSLVGLFHEARVAAYATGRLAEFANAVDRLNVIAANTYFHVSSGSSGVSSSVSSDTEMKSISCPGFELHPFPETGASFFLNCFGFWLSSLPHQIFINTQNLTQILHIYMTLFTWTLVVPLFCSSFFDHNNNNNNNNNNSIWLLFFCCWISTF